MGSNSKLVNIVKQEIKIACVLNFIIFHTIKQSLLIVSVSYYLFLAIGKKHSHWIIYILVLHFLKVILSDLQIYINSWKGWSGNNNEAKFRCENFNHPHLTFCVLAMFSRTTMWHIVPRTGHWPKHFIFARLECYKTIFIMNMHSSKGNKFPMKTSAHSKMQLFQWSNPINQFSGYFMVNKNTNA